MRGGRLALGLLLAGCASAPRAEAPPPAGDRTDDPEFAAARAAARPEFETQADALAAGVYEPFVHPDSVRPAGPGPPPATPLAAGDPTTEELLGTLDPDSTYNPSDRPAGVAAAVPPAADRAAGPWTLQLGAFDTETGALVRIQQLARDFPDLPRWYAHGAGTYRVFLGRFGNRTAADRAREAATRAGYSDAWITTTR